MHPTKTAFTEYMDDVVRELSAAHVDSGCGIDLIACVRNQDDLARFANRCQANNLNRTRHLLSIDQGLYLDLIRPALLERLAANT